MTPTHARRAPRGPSDVHPGISPRPRNTRCVVAANHGACARHTPAATNTDADGAASMTRTDADRPASTSIAVATACATTSGLSAAEEESSFAAEAHVDAELESVSESDSASTMIVTASRGDDTSGVVRLDISGSMVGSVQTAFMG